VSLEALPKLPGLKLKDLSIKACFVESVYAPGPTKIFSNYLAEGESKPLSAVKLGSLAAEVFVCRVAPTSSDGPNPLPFLMPLPK
jgi:hypothetical protein